MAQPVEAPLTLSSDDVPKLHGTRDQITLWGSLGVSLLIPATAVFVIRPGDGAPLSIAAAVTVVVLGSILGSALLGAAAVASTKTGASSMLLLRGLLGRRLSYVPTLLNIAQCFGWATLEIFVIAAVGTRLTGGEGRLWWTLAAAVIAGLLAVRPIRTAALVRRYLAWVVLAATAYLLYAVLANGITAPADGSWHQFWLAFDIVVAMPVSWAVLAGDWARHSHSTRSTFIGVGTGYAAASMLCFLIGVFAVFSSGDFADAYTPSAFLSGLMAVPIGGLALVVLAVDEIDEAFANIYSTAVSVQNLQPRIDRRLAAAAITAGAAVCALVINIEAFESFLLIIGAVFVPLTVVLLTEWFVGAALHKQAGDQRITPWQPQPRRWLFALPWLIGVVVYSRMSPGTAAGWSDGWRWFAESSGQWPSIAGSATLTCIFATVLSTLIVSVLHRRLTAIAG